MNIERLVHPGFWFDKTPMQDAIKLAQMGVGGFCLYGGTKEQAAAFTQAVQAVSPLSKILISADYEDGLGRWLADAELLPSNMALGAANDEKLAFEKGFITARQAKSLGVDWVFAPVLDLADNPQNPIVNTRSFGKNPATVIRLASALMDGLKQGGALNSLKHFPGHGDTATDSHLALPVVQKNTTELEQNELTPFRALLQKADSVMIGHLLVPALDPQKPASLSKNIISGLLRRQLGYRGCVVTDALLMKAIGDEKQAALDALAAGADILLVPEKPFELIEFLQAQKLPQEWLKRSQNAQNELCRRADLIPAVTPQEAFLETDFSAKTAKKALAQTGEIFMLSSGDTVSVLEAGNDDKLSARPFLEELKKYGVHTEKYTGGKVQKLIILCFRQYQAFKGKIDLENIEAQHLRQAASHAEQTVFVSFASPWAAQTVPSVKGALFAFSPATAFQQAAADAFCGKLTPLGKIPVQL
uniref:beta-N-acetylhexosaminidase n=1 Tax=uncultured Elusimicrobia bacterium TaxID=699876 RepID=A0A650F4C2_9BACT|nr:hypothetical protein Elusimicrob2101_1680 [uncultured Elusimicrobia bacterium]